MNLLIPHDPLALGLLKNDHDTMIRRQEISGVKERLDTINENLTNLPFVKKDIDYYKLQNYLN